MVSRRVLLTLSPALLVANSLHAQAINKSIDVGTGANGTYWRIVWWNVNMETGKVTFGVRGYIDKPAWQGGKLPLLERLFTMDLPGGAATMTQNQLVSAMRDYLKAQTDFSGATDNT